jgi:hypothetical protein
MAICDVTKEVMWLTQLLEEMKYKVSTPSVLYVYNQAAKSIAENQIINAKSKHIQVKYYFVKELVRDKKIELKWVSTKQQLADILTKAVKTGDYVKIRDALMTQVKKVEDHD